MVLSKLFIDFFNSGRAGGLVLIGCTLMSLLLTNLFPAYGDLWRVEVAGHHMAHWINDGLMTIFFLLIGLELEREIYIGELSQVKNAVLPVVAALGGMLVPAGFYILFNFSGGDLKGFGIPMATDIAFALGALSLLGDRVPASLKIFLTALAVIDDLGAILVIAVFYSGGISWLYLGISLAIFILLGILNRFKVHSLWPYLIIGTALWYCMLHSGIHATIAGVILAFTIPFGNGDENSPSYKLQRFLHKPVAFLILPLFALANTSILISPNSFYALTSSISIGIMAGLLLGKPLGITLASGLAVKLRLATLPADNQWKHIIGIGFFGGIGFTMSIFITLLAFNDPAVIDQAKIAVMIISVVAGVLGYLWLRSIFKGKSK